MTFACCCLLLPFLSRPDSLSRPANNSVAEPFRCRAVHVDVAGVRNDGGAQRDRADRLQRPPVARRLDSDKRRHRHRREHGARAAPGVDAVFTPGHSISIDFAIQRRHCCEPAEASSIGTIEVLHNSSDACYALRSVIEDTDVVGGACAVQLDRWYPTQFIFADSRLAFDRIYSGTPPNGVCALGRGGDWQVPCSATG